jgi:hypothetical protein
LPDGRFACVQFPRDEGVEHRKRIFALVGVRDEKPALSKRAYETSEQAIADKERELKMKATRRDFYNLRFLVVRFDPKKGKKEFRPFYWSDEGWICSDPPEKLPLFNLGPLRERPTDRVYLVEGEKCVCELRDKLGLLAITSAHGAKAVHKTDWTPLAGRKVVILPDLDRPGEDYAHKAADMLLSLEPPARIKIVQLPDLPSGDDCIDWLQGRNGESSEDTIAHLETLVAAAAEEKKSCLI